MTEHIQFETNGVTVLSVPLEQDSIDIVLQPHNVITYRPKSIRHYLEIQLPEGDWSIHAVTPDISDIALEKLLPETFKGRRYSHFCDILKAQGIDPKQKNVLLIKRK